MKRYASHLTIRSNVKGFNLFFTFLAFFLLASLFVFPIQKGHCAQVTLTWDPNSESDLAGYDIYCGTASGNYQPKIDVGNVTTYTKTGLDIGATYYFAATAHNTQGLESGFSNEVVYTVPGCTYTISPSSASISASGGSGSVLVTTQAGCNWSTSAAASWVTINSGSGTGSGTMTYTVASNTGTTERVSSLTVAGNIFTITEAGLPAYTITATAGTGGSISPSGAVSVQSGGSQTYTITPNSGYSISSVTVDGGSQGAIASYTFSAVNANHSIVVTFAAIISQSYQITAEVGTGIGLGTINPTTQAVTSGSTTTFTVIPNSGYTATATGCGGTLSNQTFTTGAITGACTITVNFFSSLVCQNQPVKIVRTATSYATLQEAYLDAADNDIIQAQALSLTGNLSVNRNISVTMEGGYSCDFGTQTGNMTSLFGMMETYSGGGTITIKNFTLTK